MHKIHEQRLRLSRVTAVFEDRALSFILANGATLEELSDRLADLGRHNGCPVAITVKFGTVKFGAVKFGASSRKADSHRSRRPGSGDASRDLV